MQFTTFTARGATATATGTTTRRATTGNRRFATLWTFQALLAAVFLFAGASKLVISADTLADQSDLPVLLMRFVGVCEVLGAAGLVLPGILHIRPRLTALAATGLVVIMIGAVVSTVVTMSVPAAIAPLAVGIIAAAIAINRYRTPSATRRRA
jgi:hypothetical protein